MGAHPQVINAMTEQADWLVKVQEEMGHGREILLLLPAVEQSKSRALAKLCHAYHYSQQLGLTSELCQEFEMLLDMSDFAAKEHGISMDVVCLLQPEINPNRRLQL